jgi:hypothetical protein
MMVLRRIYYCKLNQAGPATELFGEVARITREADPHTHAIRIYTDLSGLTNRVVLETEREVFESPREVSRFTHGHPDAPGVFGRLSELIERSEVEFLQLEGTV